MLKPVPDIPLPDPAKRRKERSVYPLLKQYRDACSKGRGDQIALRRRLASELDGYIRLLGACHTDGEEQQQAVDGEILWADAELKEILRMESQRKIIVRTVTPGRRED
jgi:hypothetical protein